MYSSITKKVIMSLAGLFLITFLLVHLGLNLVLIFDKSRETFNLAAPRYCLLGVITVS